MTNAVSILLMLALGATSGTEVVPKRVETLSQKSSGKPDWAKDIPAEYSRESTLVIHRRIEMGGVVRVRAVVKRLVPNALESFSLNGAADINLSGTRLKLVFPEKFEGIGLVILHDRMPPSSSCWRLPGCEVGFDIYERLLEAEQAGIDTWWLIYDTELKAVTFTLPVARKKVKQTTPKSSNR